MAWYPGATKRELEPESDAQPAIRPTQLILHSIAAPWSGERMYEYWRDSTNLESQFGCAYDGGLWQYIGTETRADANASANRRPDGTGAVSVETASNLEHTDPWTDAQVDSLIRLGVWMHERHDLPLRICRTWDDPGYGYHRLFAKWSIDGTACPGDARVQQFHDLIFPGIVRGGPTQENEMTPDQERMLREVHAALTYKGWDYRNPPSGPDAWGLLNRAADPTTVLGYRNQDDVKAALAAGRPAPPDVFGLIGETHERVADLEAKLAEALAALKGAGK